MTLEQILDELNGTEPWKARVMGAAAAERTAPLFRHLGRPQSVETFETALTAAWNAVTSEPSAKEARAARRLPELKQDDSHNPEYYAGRMLQILVRALDYPSTPAADCVESTANLCDDIDVLLTAARTIRDEGA